MPNISFNTNSLREFQKRSAFITRNEFLPILANLKLEWDEVSSCWKLEKNNLEAVCVGRVEATGEPAILLLDERIFFGFVTQTTAEQITIKISDAVITVSDGQTKIDLPRESLADYAAKPVIPPEAEISQLSSQHIRAIGIAVAFTNPSETAGNFRFVHIIADGSVFGFHNNFFYINTAFAGAGLPEMSLRADECNMLISAPDSVGFTNLPNHHVFFSSGYTYIFTKSEALPLNITGVVDRLRLPGHECIVSRNGVTDFCNVANLVSQMPLADCLLAPVEGTGQVRLSLKDANYNRAADRVLPCQGVPEPFAFNSRLLAPVLKAIPYDQLEAKTNQNCFIVSGRGGAGNGLGSEANEWFCFLGLQK